MPLIEERLKTFSKFLIERKVSGSRNVHNEIINISEQNGNNLFVNLFIRFLHSGKVHYLFGISFFCFEISN